MDINLHMLFICLDITSTDIMVLMHDNKIPSTKIDTVQESLKEIISEFMEYDSEWLEVNLLDFRSTDNNNHDVYYACIVPEAIPPKKGGWVNITTTADGELIQNVKEIVSMAYKKIGR